MNKKIIPIILGIAIVGLSAYYGATLYADRYSKTYALEGYVKYVSPAAHTITVTEDTGKEFTVTGVPDELPSTAGQDVRIEEIAQGWGIKAAGARDKARGSLVHTTAVTIRPIAGMPCATCLTEAKNGATIAARPRSHIMIEMPADKYAKNALALAPQGMLEPLNLDIPTGKKWVVIYQPVKLGTVTVTIPGKNASVPPFKANITISE